ncbi:MAG TPA: cysteine--tRNA ligase [Candidatus Saccharibacteria bacterium]|nr:cysteine--tRNA ligase [Candidatus Saccharibacteria bacterium]
MTKLKLYNTLTRKVEEFNTLKPGKVKMYTCGITVYSQPHIGNWLAYIYSDILHRTLLSSGYDVERTQNITDVGHLVSDDDDGEDKMEKGAKSENMTAWQVADKYIKICEAESAKLNLLKPTNLVRATDLIPEQIEFVKELEAKGYTYQIDDGIYFDTSKLEGYGKLAKLDLHGLQDGARIANTDKKNKTDFALWKFSPKNQQRDMEWDSPWGKGFPGWHLECSVIARETLGDQIDIHTGGIDHIPVHHTNEIAQTETLTGKKPFSAFWFHNNHIKVNGTKISKSLGNIFTLQDIEEKGLSLDAFRLMVLSSHYQTEGNFSWEILEAAQNRLDNWVEASALVHQGDEGSDNSDFEASIKDALNNNIDTPTVLSLIDQFVDEINQNSLSAKLKVKNLIETTQTLLGINLSVDDISSEQKNLLSLRQKARDEKDFAESDRIRDLLLEQGIKLKDTECGQVWSRV